MFRRFTDLEKMEARHLASWGQRSSETRGRVREEVQHPFRTDFQRDRDRIVHSRLFRRLEYKTQVFLSGAGDHYRTRMTHTMEVSCIARTMARALGLNEDLAEAIALAHDLGHPPFGHLGEKTLDELMHEYGGFEHNRQSLRVVTELEMKYPEFNGLNLTWEVREGLQKPFNPEGSADGFIQPSLEAQAVDVSDKLAYICHDLDDGLESGLILEPELKVLPMWCEVSEKALKNYPSLESERGRVYTLRCLLGSLAEDVVEASSIRLEANQPAHADEARRLPRQIGFSEAAGPKAEELLRFLYSRLYHHTSIQKVNERSAECIRQLFRMLVGHPHLMAPRFELRIKKEGVHRAVCDFLACQTDRQILHLHGRYVGGTPSLEMSRLEQGALF